MSGFLQFLQGFFPWTLTEVMGLSSEAEPVPDVGCQSEESSGSEAEDEEEDEEKKRETSPPPTVVVASVLWSVQKDAQHSSSSSSSSLSDEEEEERRVRPREEPPEGGKEEDTILPLEDTRPTKLRAVEVVSSPPPVVPNGHHLVLHDEDPMAACNVRKLGLPWWEG